ncbi:MAG TPA: RDD family protein [Gammaproteobacteria bacterium]|nr:RDD family protein [Gammaproteobacteria bacterium]
MRRPAAGAVAKNAGRIGVLRSFGAMFYDALLLFSVWYVVTALAVWMRGGQSIAAGDPKLTVVLIACTYLYFAGQWTRGGQTLGMKTWRIRLTMQGGTRPPGWFAASARFVVAVCSLLTLGFGYLWALWDTEGLTLPDRLSGTRRRLADDRP